MFTGFGYAQIAFWTVLSLISLLDTTEEALISLVIPYLRCQWNLTLFFEGTITVSVFLFYGLSMYLVASLKAYLEARLKAYYRLDQVIAGLRLASLTCIADNKGRKKVRTYRKKTDLFT